MINMSLLLILFSEMLDNKTEVQSYNLTVEEIKNLQAYYGYYANNTRKIDRGFCDECKWLIQDLANLYAKNYHGYISIVVCVFGTVANLLNVIVLTRKDIACAPINRILTGLAVADMLLMMEYMTFAYYYHIELPYKMNFPFYGAVFILFHLHFTQIVHTISVCLTLALAIWRYLAIGWGLFCEKFIQFQ